MANPVNRKGNLALLDPGASCLLFIDFDETLRGMVPEVPVVSAAHHEILGKAAELSIPAFLSFMENEGEERSGSSLDRLIPEDARLPRSVINPWKDDRLRQSIAEHRRHRLILAGGWPEGSLAQAALGALGEAYDVYVLFDLCNGLLDLQNSPVAARLIQAGVVPLTARQLILEWTGAAGTA